MSIAFDNLSFMQPSQRIITIFKIFYFTWHKPGTDFCCNFLPVFVSINCDFVKFTSMFFDVHTCSSLLNCCFFKSIRNPYFDNRLSGDSQTASFFIKWMNHPNRKVNINPFLFLFGSSCISWIKIFSNIFSLYQIQNSWYNYYTILIPECLFFQISVQTVLIKGCSKRTLTYPPLYEWHRCS